MSHPPPHTSAHENDSTLETKHQPQQEKENCDQKQRARSLPSPLINTSLFTPKPFGAAGGGSRPCRFSSCFNSFPGTSDQIQNCL